MSLLIEELFFGRGLAHCYGCSFGDRPVMAVQLERQLKAAQKFLIGVQSLPNFLEIRRKQLTELLRCSGKVNVLSIDASGRLLEAVNEALWGDDANELKNSIAELTGQAESNKDRSKNQNYLACVHYFSSDLVAQLESNRNRHQVLEHVCSHLAKLGLRHPTEKTQGLILALSFDFHGLAFESDKWQYTQLHKAGIQRLLNKPQPSVYCEELPNDPQQCPRDLFLLAFPEGSQPCALANPAEMILRGRNWPMRTSHRIAAQASMPQASSSKPDYYAVGQMVAGMMSTGQPASSSRPASVVPAAPVAAASKPRMLALEDGSVEERTEAVGDGKVPAVTAGPSAQQPSGETGVAATLAALKKQLDAEPPELTTEMAMKRPAAAKVSKKPASAKGNSAQPKKGLKRPAAAMAALEKIPADSRRQWLVRSKVPLHLVELWKQGCSRCYHRSYCTPSCWKRRGYPLL